ncbi:tRNA (cytidine(34)-2'-O)-methyltransferase [Thermopetrobacter sp. TC1]|uniref:tRNA (cytidine(34)-2'-O)-methyltransferase n=1 Tax=Thermopetrobacter sp. TC1 TaxID=1495045 RepID=UPI00056DC10F|nr:tRNA (cytidine(34)-2'-O)-methyltransferase [Thermopetrobacter sp. TC1]
MENATAAPIAVALYQPDIPANLGATARMCACFGLPLHVIEPAGFPWSHKALKRAGMDYLDHVRIIRHDSWQAFLKAMGDRRLILASTRAAFPHHAFFYAPGDILLFGRECCGVPQEVHDAAHARVRIPLRPGLRSLNVAMSAGIIAAEALRQLSAFPEESR